MHGILISWIDWQLCFVGQDDLPASIAIPKGKRYAKVTLARDTPVPMQVLNPFTVTHLHMFGIPDQLFSCIKQLLFAVKDTDKPLRCDNIFNGCITAFMNPYCLGDRLLTK